MYILKSSIFFILYRLNVSIIFINMHGIKWTCSSFHNCMHYIIFFRLVSQTVQIPFVSVRDRVMIYTWIFKMNLVIYKFKEKPWLETLLKIYRKKDMLSIWNILNKVTYLLEIKGKPIEAFSLLFHQFNLKSMECL